jgi:L-glutamine-phosphate cytidylyltransferase
MKAIILAAGEGKRLRPLTADQPKCLVKYQGKPILDYQIENFRQCGIEDIIVMKGHKADVLDRPGIQFLLNRRHAQTNMVYTLFCAREHFTDDLIISYGDIVYERSILEAVIGGPGDLGVAISTNWRELWEKRMPNPLSDAETLKLNADGHVIELGKKPSGYEEIQGQYMGLFKIKKSMLSKTLTIYDSLDRNALYDGKNFDNMFMTSFIQIIIDRGIRVQAIPVSGEWLEVDTLDDLNITCNV